jgi:hypothetical protein
MRRVLRWDGTVTQTDDVGEIKAIAEYVDRERPTELRSRRFEIVVQGRTTAGKPAAAKKKVAPYASAGATWWIEADWSAPTLASIRRRIEPGGASRWHFDA